MAALLEKEKGEEEKRKDNKEKKKN